MKNLFIPYELAVIAKEKGFDEPCIAFGYPIENGPIISGVRSITNSQYNEFDKSFAWPMYQQIVDWFRDRHKLMIYISFTGTTHKGVITWANKKGEKSTGLLPRKETVDRKDYYKSFNQAIEEAFKLI